MTAFYDNGTVTKEEADAQARHLLDQMSLTEKVWLLNGNWDIVTNVVKHKNPYNPTPIKTNGCKRLGISPIAFTDGPRGVVMGHATCFPVSMARGASFDPDLEARVGDVIGREARALGANYFAGVCINLLRHPAWGRAQETYGEDPFHVGEFGLALTQSVQAHNVMACLKHYAVNNIENSRFFVDVKADGRVMREIYLPHFKKSVDGGAASLMGAYNLYEGDQACESHELQTEILRDEWGFEGFTISDFMFGIRDTKKAIEAGMDVEMPMPVYYQKKLLAAVKRGEIAEEIVDQAALRVLRTLAVFESRKDPEDYSVDQVACHAHAALALEAAEQSMVLIKNENATLPFANAPKKILVVGKLAAKPNTGDYGSSRIYAPYVVTPLQGLQNYFGDTAEITHCTEAELDKAKALAPDMDCVIFVAGNDARDEGEHVDPGSSGGVSMDIVVEGTRNQGQWLKSKLINFILNRGKSKSYTGGGAVGGDRHSLSLKAREIEAIKAIAPLNPNCVVTLIGGSMIMTEEWDEDVPAILYGWYAGMEGGNALARVLFGDVNPSGKLPFTIPHSTDDLPYFSSTDEEITYDLYHGYSLLDKNGTSAAYAFGHGLSYSTFTLSGLSADKNDDVITLTVSVQNTGDRAGAEVVQAYINAPGQTIELQKKLLKAFQKVWLEAGESRNITLTIPLDELRYYCLDDTAWKLESGDHGLIVGNSSNDESALRTTVML